MITSKRIPIGVPNTPPTLIVLKLGSCFTSISGGLARFNCNQYGSSRPYICLVRIRKYGKCLPNNTSISVSTEILDRLGKLDPNKTLKTLVAEAIVEHIGNKTLSVTNKTPDIGFLNVDMTPNIGTIQNNQMHV